MDPTPTFGSFHVALLIFENAINRANFKKIHVIKPSKEKDKDKEKENEKEKSKKRDYTSPLGVYKNLRKRDNKPKENNKLSDKLRCAECHDTGGNLVPCCDCERYFHSDCIDQNEDGGYICYECQNNNNDDEDDEDDEGGEDVYYILLL